MIHLVYSNLPTFKQLLFHPGLNVLLADKSPGATDLQTRNGAGKTSFVELIHFLMGANADKDSLFRKDVLSEFSFAIDFDLGGVRTIVERSGSNSSKIIVRDADPSTWPVQPEPAKNPGELVISNNNWRTILGKLMFGLTGADDGEQAARFGPTFRALFAYFVRRQSANAFISPVKQSAIQQLADQQVAISYLLGLDWTIAQQWQEVREREASLKELRKAASGGALGPLIGTTAALRTQLAVAEDRTRQLREHVNAFQVLPEYRNLETEASRLTRNLGTLADENTIDRQLLSDLQQALDHEVNPSFSDLERLYEEAGVVLSGAVVRRFEDVRAFHQSITENRRSYLGSEVEGARRRIANREEQMRQLDGRRTAIMSILRSHGALDQYAKLQSELSRQEAETEVLRQRFAAAEQLEGRKTELDIERQQLLLRLRQDYREQKDVLNHAILAFEETSSALYEEAGNLTIEESLNGPKFEVKIRGENSKGISNMQIFCFDMMLMRLCAERGFGPGFLVHDSHLFDGVDERQVAKALQIGAKAAEELNYQYIVTMNSDAIPQWLPDGFNLDDYILPVRLTDATDEGGLFGIRF